MENMQRFVAYASDFEKTLADDDWRRLRQYFTDDAVYEVISETLGCKLTGPDAIFAGMKRSLDGLDRKFSSRDVAVSSGPEIDGDEIRMGWTVTYHRQGWTDFVLHGRSTVRHRDGKIVSLSDTYEPGMEPDFAAWEKQNGVRLDASYSMVATVRSLPPEAPPPTLGRMNGPLPPEKLRPMSSERQ